MDNVLRKLSILTLGAFALVLASHAWAQTSDAASSNPLADETRPAEDVEQDAWRKPLELYEWLGIKSGQTVVDLYAGTGYNTHLLSRVVGPQGRVVAVMGFYGDPLFFGGRPYAVDTIAKRVADAGIRNALSRNEISELSPATADVVLCVRNYHDVEWLDTSRTRADVVADLMRVLKPGGVVGIVDVATDRPGWDGGTHRLNAAVVIEDFEKGGFRLVDQSDLLSSDQDDYSKSRFQQPRDQTDRYVLKFRKPGM